MNPLRTTAFLATADAERARAFYVDRLHAELVEDTPFSLVMRIGGTLLRIQKVEQVLAPPYTSLGWQVDDLAAEVRALRERGVDFERFEGMGQDDAGIWIAPDGAKIAWFRDPDGQLLSLDQQP
ncbi:VOC family protein [Wenzhouxiangella sp. XN79A]|uniref:VOC family protein n=1 Tax=Wenzhouxiangella sp. XN79A TaxID=2724193 RepID=UPI00144AE842|nr:VOC family protein [Wenzhouxiangella sp. XN79A]NKI35354.1 VOC family protein [Wenzhouxiangella sp. XN79A]